MKRAALTIMVFLIASTLVAADKWATAYQLGVVAAQKGDWKTVIEQMSKAIAEKPREEASARVRNQTVSYTPHYWLGTAKLNLGDVAGGLEAYRTSESHGVIQKTAHYSEVRAALAKASASPSDQQKKDAEAAKRVADKALSKAMAAQVKATSAGATRSDVFRRGTQKLQESFELKKSATKKSYEQAAVAANEAADLFTQAATGVARPVSPNQVAKKNEPAPVVVVQQVEEKKEQPVATPVQQAEVKAEEPKIDAKSVETAKKSLRGLSQELSKAASKYPRDPQITAFQRSTATLISEWRESLDDPDNQMQVDSIRRGADQQMQQLATLTQRAQVAATVPAISPADRTRDLVAQAYLEFSRGDLLSAEQIASQLIKTPKRQIDGYMLRGCARYTRAVLSQKKDLENAAAADFQAAIKLDRSARLDPRHFSPKLVTFFQEVKKSL